MAHMNESLGVCLSYMNMMIICLGNIVLIIIFELTLKSVTSKLRGTKERILENYLNEKEIETPLELRNLSSSHGLELSLIYIGSASVFFTILFIFSNYIKKMNQMNAKIYVKTKMKI